MDSLQADPLDRLVSGKREFGEFGGVNASVEISTTFTVMEADTLPAIFNGEVGPEKGGCYVYGRAFNPTVRHLGRLLAALEGCEAAYPCSSGMAAISSTLMALCNSGDHIVASNTIYGGSHALLKTFLPTKAAITTTFVDITDLAAVRSAVQQNPGRTKVLYTEVVSNPTLRVADLRALADLAHASGAQLVVDNTFTPFVVTPRRFGADVVIHSLTKFVSGASDIIAGAICGSAAFIRSLMDFHAGPCMLLGPTMDPRVASELTLRLPNLALRMQEHGRRAAAFAARLEALGAAVTYPGLPSHPQYKLMVAQANDGYGLGGLMGLDLGTPARANVFMERLQNRHGFGFMAVSLGYFDTLMSLSAASTSSELSEGDLAVSGIGRGYVRISVGITGTLEGRWQQLEEAYRFVMQLGPTAAVPYRALKMRRSPSGAVEQLLSWPSLGSFGLGAMEAQTAATAAAAAATAAAKPNGNNNGTSPVGVGVGVGGDGELSLEGPGLIALSNPGQDGDDSDVSSAPPSLFPVTALSPFLAATAATAADGRGAEVSQLASTVDLRTATNVISSTATPPAVRHSPSGVVATTDPRDVACFQGDSEHRQASGSGIGSESGRPIKIRRTGSSEIHYVAVQTPTSTQRDA